MVGLERDRAMQRVEPRLATLIRHRVNEVDADVRNAHRPRQAESSSRLGGIGLSLQDREGTSVESLNAEAQTIHPAIEPGRDPRLVGAGWIRLDRHLSVGREIEGAANESEQSRYQVRGQQARRAASQVDGVELLECVALAGERQLPFQRVDVVRHEPVHPRVGVEVAVPALVLAEGDVEIKVAKVLELAHTPLMVYRCPRADSSSRRRWSAASRSLETSSLILCPIRSSIRAICRPICSTFAFCERYRSRLRHRRACSSRSSATERRTWQSTHRPLLVCELGTCLPQSRQKINRLLI